MAVNEQDQTPPSIWNNTGFRYGLLVLFLLLLLSSCYCSVHARRRARNMRPVPVHLLDARIKEGGPPPVLEEAFVDIGREGEKNAAEWEDIKVCAYASRAWLYRGLTPGF
jgi:hypothetical protein